jgi:hypothetical protein
MTIGTEEVGVFWSAVDSMAENQIWNETREGKKGREKKIMCVCEPAEGKVDMLAKMLLIKCKWSGDVIKQG